MILSTRSQLIIVGSEWDEVEGGAIACQSNIEGRDT